MERNFAKIAIILSMALIIVGCETKKGSNLTKSPRFSEVTDFEEIFEKIEEIVLDSREDAPLGTILDADVYPTGNLVVLDFEQKNIKKYDRKGNLIRVLGQRGRGAGQFIFPIDLCVDAEGKIYVTDLKGARTNVFDPQGNLLQSFMMFEGYSPRKIEVDSKGRIYIGGLKYLTKKEALLIHKYAPDGRYIKSFYPMNEKIGEMFLWFTTGVLFDIDKDNYLYCAQPVAYEISKYDSEGRLIKEFSREAYFYTPPTAIAEEETSKAFINAWIDSWTQVANIKVSPSGFVFVVFNTHKPTEFVIDIYNREGEFVKGGISTDLRLLCFGQNNFAYFATNTSADHKILKYSVNLSNPKGGNP